MSSGSPAWMPATIGSATLASASRPRRRRTKSPRLSSSPRAGRAAAAGRAPCAPCRGQLIRLDGRRAPAASAPSGSAPRAARAGVRREKTKLLRMSSLESSRRSSMPSRAASSDRPRLLDDERVGAALDHEAVAALRLHLAAQDVGPSRTGASRRGRRRSPPATTDVGGTAGLAADALERVGGAQAGHAAADHGDRGSRSLRRPRPHASAALTPRRVRPCRGAAPRGRRGQVDRP